MADKLTKKESDEARKWLIAYTVNNAVPKEAADALIVAIDRILDMTGNAAVDLYKFMSAQGVLPLEEKKK